MSKSDHTKAALLTSARKLFWWRGYSNVPLRQIAGAAGVDVALIARYFGSKRGLFDATLVDLPALDPDAITTPAALVETVVTLFASAPRDGSRPPETALILMNSGDPEVGEAVQDIYKVKWQRPLEIILGDKGKAALFSAAMLGMSVAEKTLHLDGIATANTDAYSAQFRGLLIAVLADAGGPASH